MFHPNGSVQQVFSTFSMTRFLQNIKNTATFSFPHCHRHLPVSTPRAHSASLLSHAHPRLRSHPPVTRATRLVEPSQVLLAMMVVVVLA
jgi:hypothetical protein